MQEIKVDSALWATSMLPEGVVERWLVVDGAIVAAGDRMAELRIEDALRVAGQRSRHHCRGREYHR
jgi:hypothetical protein